MCTTSKTLFLPIEPIMILICILLFIILRLCKLFFLKREPCCYMLAYECYKAPEDRKLDTGTSAKIVFRNKNLGIEEYRFLLRTIACSGIGEETYGPVNVISGQEDSPTLKDSISEMDVLIFDTLDKLFAKTGILPSEIDILVVNVSLFSPAPSLAARVVNRYRMRSDIKTFNLSGMGCSASVVSIDLVQHLFKSSKNAFAVVVSTESIGANWYRGKEKSMMLSNCLFRSGGCSMLFTNNSALKRRAIRAYGCCMQTVDDLGYKGFLLTKSLKNSAAQALSLNLRVLAPKMLPVSELIRYVYVSHREKKTKSTSRREMGAGLNLKTGVDHLCIHPGGRAIIDEVGKSLGLDDYDLEPARMALHRFGNTSAGGLWYVLGYMEAKQRLKKGNKILMISLGAGFKCNNCVWEVMRDLGDVNVWKDSIDQYPPETVVNPFIEKLSWINDEHLSFVRFH
ncbi:3-ketoacyl-CoA synthase [Salix suchowensis]|nr:3-ketoacyl-CoA synthase [Salix suchowensis]